MFAQRLFGTVSHIGQRCVQSAMHFYIDPRVVLTFPYSNSCTSSTLKVADVRLVYQTLQLSLSPSHHLIPQLVGPSGIPREFQKRYMRIQAGKHRGVGRCHFGLRRPADRSNAHRHPDVT